jgi:hypothetical protein
MSKIFRSKWMWLAIGAIAVYMGYDKIKPEVEKLTAKLKGGNA